MKILIIAAHPDDEILGCGATVARLTKNNNEAFLCILGEGVKSREGWTQEEYNYLHSCIERANEKIGIPKKNIYVFEFPDNSFDSVPLLDIIKSILSVKDKVKPDIVFTHSRHCLNIDHKTTYNAVVTATRPMENETVKEIYSFEVLSSTEWNYPIGFTPNVFFDVKETIRTKVDALMQYKNEIRSFPHPRSAFGVYSNAQLWGMKVGLPFAEAFELVREIK